MSACLCLPSPPSLCLSLSRFHGHGVGSYFRAQKRYEDLVWGKEDFIYDIKEIEFRMKLAEKQDKADNLVRQDKTTS